MSKKLNEAKIDVLNEKYRKLLEKYPEWETASLRRNKAHVLGVQTFAKKIGREFPDHDLDKFNELYVPYVFISTGYNRDFIEQLNKEKAKDSNLESFIRWGSFSHVTTNSHHPESCDVKTEIIKEKNKENEKEAIDATSMSNDDIIEMCCDWSSVGSENGNSPQSWFKLNKNKKWKFTDEQEKLIMDTLEKLWPGGSKETAEIEHEERIFNDIIWDLLNKKWKEYEDNNTLRESYDFSNFEKTLSSLDSEKQTASDVLEKFNKRDYEPTINLQGVGSLQALSFLFSPAVTNYVMSLLDSIMSKSYAGFVSDSSLKSIGLGNIELGDGYSTKAKITSNFANGILKSLNNVNESKLKSKLLLSSKFIRNLNKHAKTITDKLQRQEYMDDVKAFLKVINIIKNIIDNRSNFINVLKKTLLLQESDEEIVSDRFCNIYEGI